MRSVLVGALMLAATASQAGAQITFTSAEGAPDKGFAPQQLITDFNGTLPAGINITGSFSLVNGNISGQAAAPAGVTSRYLAVPQVGPGTSSNGTAVIDFSGFLGSQTLTGLSFYWGSIDQYNSLRFLDKNGNALAIALGAGTVTSLTGTNVIASANGNQTLPSTNRRVFFDLSNTSGFAKLELRSNGRAFEIDDLAGSVAVPEPASLALLGTGLIGLVGAARRRRA